MNRPHWVVFTHPELNVNRCILRLARHNFHKINAFVSHHKRIGHLRFLGIRFQCLAGIGIIQFYRPGVLQADFVVEHIPPFQIDRIGRGSLQQAVWIGVSGKTETLLCISYRNARIPFQNFHPFLQGFTSLHLLRLQLHGVIVIVQRINRVGISNQLIHRCTGQRLHTPFQRLHPREHVVVLVQLRQFHRAVLAAGDGQQNKTDYEPTLFHRFYFFLPVTALTILPPIFRSKPCFVSGIPVLREMDCLTLVMPSARFRENVTPGIFMPNILYILYLSFSVRYGLSRGQHPGNCGRFWPWTQPVESALDSRQRRSRRYAG